jgi:hypothetical protein
LRLPPPGVGCCWWIPSKLGLSVRWDPNASTESSRHEYARNIMGHEECQPDYFDYRFRQFLPGVYQGRKFRFGMEPLLILDFGRCADRPRLS